MAYSLTIIGTNETIVLDDEVWKNALDLAEKNGWEPEGTVYDIATVLDEWCDEPWENNCNPMNDILVIMQHVTLASEWNGNYTDRENQIVSEGDANYMAYYLDGCGFDDAFIDFLNRGSFRINAV